MAAVASFSPDSDLLRTFCGLRPALKAHVRLGGMNGWTDFSHANCCPCHSTRKLAYSLDEAAAKVGVSGDLLRAQIRQDNLIARYINSKPVIEHDELVAWLRNLPTEAK